VCVCVCSHRLLVVCQVACANVAGVNLLDGFLVAHVSKCLNVGDYRWI